MLSVLLALAIQAPPAVVDTSLTLRPNAIEAPAQPDPSVRSSSNWNITPRGQSAAASGVGRAISVRVGDLMAVRGQEENVIQGVGLVTGLAGSGDTGTAARQAILNMMLTQNITLDQQAVTSANVAVVWVDALLPSGIKPGRRIDARVSAMYDCSSLVGGTLVACELTETTGRIVYGTAWGSVSTGAFSISAQGATAQKNFLTVGMLPLGCKVEREVETRLISENGYIYLDARAMKGSFENATRVANAINLLFPQMAVPTDAMTVRVGVPHDVGEDDRVPYLSALLSRELIPADTARVVLNERTGVIVMGEGVRITRGAISKGSLTVTIAENPQASQPGPLSNGETEVLPRSSLVVEEENNPLSIVQGAVTLQEVVEVLNVLGVTPRDMIQILNSMSQSGMLHAEIVVM